MQESSQVHRCKIQSPPFNHITCKRIMDARAERSEGSIWLPSHERYTSNSPIQNLSWHKIVNKKANQ
jgi:hypothetical protein